MGSRLKKVGGSRAWDPDDLLFMIHTFYNASGEERRKLLIDSKLEVNQKDAGGPPASSFSDRMRMKYTINVESNSLPAPPDWDWIGLPLNLSPDEKLEKIISTLVDHGWDEVAWGFYGDILLKLAAGHFSELSRCFVHPIYAFGYNCVEDNLQAGEKLATRIQQIIKQENLPNHPCDRVILSRIQWAG